MRHALLAGIDIGTRSSMMKMYAEELGEVHNVNPGFFIPAMAGWLMIVVFSMPVSSSGQTAWERVLNKDGIEVWTRPSPGSDLEEFMGMTVIDAPLGEIERVIDDIPAAEKWVPDCKEARVIRTLGDSEKEILFVTEAPWPISDREVIVMSHKQRVPGTGELVIDFHAIDDPSVPAGKGRVRIQSMHGRWVLFPVDAGHTRVGYSLKGDPGGYLPLSVTRMISRKIPFNTLLGLRDMVPGSG